MNDRLPPDYYAILGVPETATDEEIARAYRRLARELHPDANQGGDASRFREASAAYDIIGDRVRRDAYDASRRGPGGRGTAIPIRREGRTQQAPPPRATARELVLSFEEAVLGTTAKVQVDEAEGCQACGGSGRSPAAARPCPGCSGSGQWIRHSGGITIRQACTSCNGTGRLPRSACEACRGRGVVASTREVSVRIPAGVEDGGTVRILLRRGTAPAAGAIHATVRVRPHPYFTRHGRDLALTVPITLAEAALGGDIRVPTVDGGGHVVRIPPGTQHGQTLRIAGGGVAHQSNPGDLVVTVEVVVPKSLSDAQRRALEDFAAATEPPRQWGQGTL